MKKRVLKIELVFCILFLSAIANDLKAQDSANTKGRINISSPNASALGKYGDIPVSYYTGIPDISIPIYKIKSGEITVPVGLSYHASGLKVQEQASSVGAGWSLNAGGMITRAIRGAADDKGYYNNYVIKGYYSDSGYYNYLMHPDGSIPPSANTNGLASDGEQFAVNRKDGEPDMFTFNIGGQTGKFYFNDDQRAVLVPEQDIKIEVDYASGPGFKGFILTSSTGVKYYFGSTGNNGSVDPVEITYDISTQSTYGINGRVASSWFLNKIVTADKTDSVLFNYQQERYSYYAISMFPVYYIGGGTSLVYSGPWLQYPYEFDLAKIYTSGVRLSSITYADGSVTFNPSATPRTDLAGYTDQAILNDQANTEAKSLASIQINNSGTACKRFDFYYSYFYDNQNGINGYFSGAYPGININSDKYRLRLDSLKESACDASAYVPPYKFTYFSEQVPRKLSFGLDHWGFYNGVTTNNTLLPTSDMTTGSNYFNWAGANRDPSWPAMRGGTLQQIKYPTGGSSTLEFEPNYTYAPSKHNTFVSKLSMSVGYDCNPTSPITTTFTTSTNSSLYRLTLTSAQTAGNGGNFRIVSQDGLHDFNVLVASGATVTSYFPLDPSTTYTVYFYNYYIQCGHGISAALDEIIPVTTYANTLVGGLRIKSITNSDGISPEVSKTSYSYNIGNSPTGNSSGILYSRPTYIQIIRNDIFKMVWGQTNCYLNGCSNPGNSSTKNFYRSPSSIRPLETTQGNHIGYNEVYVSKNSGGQSNGYSVYRYYGSDLWDYSNQPVTTTSISNTSSCDLSIPNYPSAPQPFEQMRGELKYEGHFNSDNQILSDTWYYPMYAQNPLPTPAVITFSNQAIGSYTDYTLYTFKKIKQSVVSTEYVPGGQYISNTNVTYFGSMYHNSPTRSVQYTSTGDSIVKTFKYALDFRPGNCDNSVPDSLSFYLSAVSSAQTAFYSSLSSCNPQAGCGDFCYYYKHMKLRYDLSLARIQYMKYLKRNYSDVNSVFNTCRQNAKSVASADLKPILELQDQYQNPAIESSVWRNNQFLSSEFTKYNYAPGSSTKMYPYTTQLLNLGTLVSNFSTAVVSGNTITKDSRYYDDANYSYDNGRLTEVTAKNGIIVSYLWGNNNKLPIVKAIGVNYATLLAAYNAVGGNLQQLRTYSTLVNAQITTYVYTPGVGMTSETDPRGRTIYYEYDKLNRLVIVRDNENNILKKICYNYAGQPENCLPGASQTYYNIVASQVFTRNNCAPGYTGSAVTYTVAAGTYSSTTSQAAADQLAQNDISANGQAYANTNGTCTAPQCSPSACTGNDKKCINGICETGVRVNISTTQVRGGWQCVYKYIWSDGSVSQQYSEINATPCSLSVD